MNGPGWWRYWAAGPDSPIAGHSWSYRADTDTGGQHTQTKHYHLLSTSPQSWPEQTIDDCKTFINEYAYYDRMSYAEKKYICRAIKGKRSWYKTWKIMIPWPVQRLLIGLDNSSPDSWRPAHSSARSISSTEPHVPSVFPLPIEIHSFKLLTQWQWHSMTWQVISKISECSVSFNPRFFFINSIQFE